MSIILLLGVAVAAAIASAIVIIRWALSRDRPPRGFPMDRRDDTMNRRAGKKKRGK